MKHHPSILPLVASVLTLFLLGSCGSSSDSVAAGAAASSKSTAIGPGGGQATSKDGVVTLTFPVGALAAAQVITITKLTAAGLSPGMSGFGPDQAYRFDPDGLVFAVPVQLSIGIGAPVVPSPGNLIASVPSIMSEAGGVLAPVVGGDLLVTETSQTITFPINHFSTYATKVEEDPFAAVSVRYPTALTDMEKQNVFLDFIGELIVFQSWNCSVSGTILSDCVVFNNSMAASFPDDVSFEVWCQATGSSNVRVEASYAFFNAPEGTPSSRIVVNVSIETTCANPGITEDTYVDLAPSGATKLEAVIRAQWCSASLFQFWVAVAGGALRYDLETGEIVENIVRSGDGFDIIPTQSSDGAWFAAVFGGSADGDFFREEPDCVALGTNLFGPFLDGTQVNPGDQTAGVVSAPANRVSIFTYGIDNTGGILFEEILLNQPVKSVVGNAVGAFFMVVTLNNRLVHVNDSGGTIAATETFVADLGSDPRRMRWDPDSGIGGISDFTDDALTVFFWDGTVNLPIIIGTVAVGDGPVGIDVEGNRIVCAGFNDDSYTLIEVDLNLLTVTSTVTIPIPFTAPQGGPLQPGHAIFVRDGNNTIGFSFWAAAGLGFTPFAF